MFNFRSKDTNLIEAINNHDHETVKSLLQSGVDPNELSTKLVLNRYVKMTALMMAIKERNVEAMKLLVEHGADIELRDIEGNTALLLTAGYAFKEGFDYLVSQGADLHAINDFGWNGYHYAVQYNELGIIDVLIENQVNMNQRNNLDMSPLSYAYDENIKAARKLIQSGAELNRPDQRSGMTLLMHAAMKDQLLLFKALVEGGADFHSVDKEENDAQSIAEYFESKYVLDYLAEQQATMR